MEPDERIGRVIGELRSLVEALAEEGRAKTEAIETEAEVAVGRYYDAVEELDASRREIVRLQDEREDLPRLAYIASMDERTEEEARLKKRYRELPPAIEALRARVAELEGEVASLVGKNPGIPEGTYYDAQLVAYTRVREAYRDASAPLYEIEKQVGEILRPAIGPLAGGLRGWGATLQGIRDQRTSDPEVRRRSLQRRGIRVE